jgi:hypothetical protein
MVSRQANRDESAAGGRTKDVTSRVGTAAHRPFCKLSKQQAGRAPGGGGTLFGLDEGAARTGHSGGNNSAGAVRLWTWRPRLQTTHVVAAGTTMPL